MEPQVNDIWYDKFTSRAEYQLIEYINDLSSEYHCMWYCVNINTGITCYWSATRFGNRLLKKET